MSIRSLRQDQNRREIVLGVALVLFGAVGFAESALNLGSLVTMPNVRIDAGSAPLLVSAVGYVLFGGVMSYFFGGYLLSETRPATPVHVSFAEEFSLSSREQEVVELLNRGLSNREIAEKLFVSLATIKTHVHNIYEKTGAGSRFELFHMQQNR